MNTTSPQPDPSPAQREERLCITQHGLLYVECPSYRDNRSVADVRGYPEDSAKADAIRLKNGWNALPILALVEKELRDIKTISMMNDGPHTMIADKCEAALTAIRESKGK